MIEPLATLQLSLPPDRTAVAALGQRLAPLLRGQYGPHAACDAVELAAVELLANVVRHGRGTGTVAIYCRLHADYVEFEMSDDGEPFDMAAATPSQLPPPLAESGRGLWLVHEAVGPLCYSREGARNVHRFRRALIA